MLLNLREKPQCYGIISERAKNIRDDYEYIYRHYTSRGISLPYTKIAADSTRPGSTRNTITAFRSPSSQGVKAQVTLTVSNIGYPAGAMTSPTVKAPDGSLAVSPGQSVQDALNSAAGTGRWVVAKAGIHTLPETLKIPGGVTLTGKGLGTVLFLDPSAGIRVAIVNKDTDMHDVTYVIWLLREIPGLTPGRIQTPHGLSTTREIAEA